MGEKILARRRDLQKSIRKPFSATHAGLWLDKFLEVQGDDESKKKLVEQVAEDIETPPAYSTFFEHWEAALKRAGAQVRYAETRGRLAVNLGTESVLETSIALHRTWGVPYIPGSALKGLTASFAHQHLEGDEWRKDTGDAYKELFGTTDQAGCVTFFDALYVPDSGHRNRETNVNQALWSDVITVHHPKYYRGEKSPPADWDSPTPIPFLSATGKFLIALAGPDEWVKIAFDILEKALEQEGIGAKTNSGYGRMELQPVPEEEQPAKWYDTPSKEWDWRVGRISGGFVRDLEDPNKRFPVDKKRIVPAGYTLPGKKKNVHYVVLDTETGEKIVWIKQLSYEIPD